MVLLSLLAGVKVMAQIQPDKNVFSNSGEIWIEPNTDVSLYLDVENTETGKIQNHGNVYVFKHFKNDGIYDFDDTKYLSGKTFFQKSNYLGTISEVKNISGKGASRFYSVIFDRIKENDLLRSFDLSQHIEIYKNADFLNGVVKLGNGSVTFLDNATHNLEMNRTLGDNSHIEGEVNKIGKGDFVFPIGKNNGKENLYRFSRISSPDSPTDEYASEYFLKASQGETNERPHEFKSSTLKAIDPAEYWTLLPQNKTKGSVEVTLSYDERTTPAFLLEDLSLLRVVRWDEKSETWIDEGGFLDPASKTVTTAIPSGEVPREITEFGEKGIFTLGIIKPELKNGIVIYNGVSVNNDGKNDYFGIDNLNFPENRLRIFNRWGRLVYETENYDTKGNVFKGFAESGSLVLDKGKKLPTGTYYYLFEYKDKQGEIQKHTGWLYLKSDNEVSF